jgi:uncharacterized LabA/DUF88 family protein
MADQTYVFIDGRYLLQRHKEAMQGFFGVDGDIDMSPILRIAGSTRVYFYDAIDYARLPNETETAWEARIVAAEQFFAKINTLEGFHVRPGSVRRSKKREQKEVDVLLAVDMVTFGFSGTISRAVLIAGDVDLRPAVEELVRRGVVVHVWYHPSSFAQELPGAADLGREIRFSNLYSWNSNNFRAAHPVPYCYSQGGMAYGDLVKTGSLYGWPVELRKTGPGSPEPAYLLWIQEDPALPTWNVLKHADLGLIERYVRTEYGQQLEWEATANEIHVTGGAP